VVERVSFGHAGEWFHEGVLDDGPKLRRHLIS
jgi:hypothetical protein